MQSIQHRPDGNLRELRSRLFRGANPSRPRCAFTIIELLIVVIIMGILTAVTAPTFFNSLLFHRVESAARRVKADLELARTQARLTSASQTVTFANSTYTLSNTTSLDKPGAIYSVDLKKEPYSLDGATPNFSSAAIVTFDGYGTPTSGGTVVLVAKAHACTVTLNGTTGDVTITSGHSGGRTAQVAGN
jgi:prepilin-type N-terminal cleavage/methylation domain-containing protein